MSRKQTDGHKAWLITWEGDDAKSNGRCKIVSIFPPQLSKTSQIEFVLRLLYGSEYQFTLGEKLYHGIAKKKDRLNLFRVAYKDICPKYYYGCFPHEYLFARVVKDLRCEQSSKSDFEATLHWT